MAINPRNGEIYFTDSLYGYLQAFRPTPGIPPLVYRLNADTGAISVVADLLDKPNGIYSLAASHPHETDTDEPGVTFSPNASYAYVTDTGAQNSNYGINSSAPATM